MIKNIVLCLFLFLQYNSSGNTSIIIGGESAVPILMPLGDSITVGAGDQEATSGQFGYRDHLQDLLGVGNYRFVGPYTDPDTDLTYDVNHAGIGGQTAALVSARLDGLLTTYFNSVLAAHSSILIHVGTNDCNQSVSNNTTVAHISNMINKIDSFDSTINVYVAKITPTHTGVGSLNTCVDSLNTAIQTAVLARQATKTNVHLVDMNAAFKSNTNWEADYMSNVGVSHPGDSGYIVMAQTWYTCMQNPSVQYCDGN